MDDEAVMEILQTSEQLKDDALHLQKEKRNNFTKTLSYNRFFQMRDEDFGQFYSFN